MESADLGDDKDRHALPLTRSRFARASGLPQISAHDPALLRGNAQWLLHAHDAELHGYRLRHCGDEIEAECCWRVALPGKKIAALAESRFGVVVAVQRGEDTELWRVVHEQAHQVCSIPGTVSSLTCLGASAFAVTNGRDRLNATLVEIDLYRQAVASERPLPGATVEVNSDVTGSYLGVIDRSQRTFMVLNPKGEDPCGGKNRSDPASVPQGTLDAPPPGEAPPEATAVCCCTCSTPHQPPGSRTGSPGGSRERGGQPPRAGSGPCQPGDGGVPTPGGGSVSGRGGSVVKTPSGADGGGINPCTAYLGWRAHLITAAAGSYLVADATGRNFAVLSGSDMRVLHSRAFGRAGARVLVDPISPVVLIQHGSTKEWEVLHTDALLSALHQSEWTPPFEPADAGKTFDGLHVESLMSPHANATGTVQTLVLPVLEAGQTFNDPDLPKLGAYLERTAFSRIRDYYFENSFGLLKDIRYHIYGLDTGPIGGPLRLPRLVSDYYWPKYDPARVVLTKAPITLPYTLVFDGRESLTVKAQSATGGRPPKTITLKFPALLVAKAQQHFPAQIRYTGAETATVKVTLPSGAAKTLTLKFPAQEINFEKEADVVPGMNTLITYLDGVFAAAESAAGIFPRLFTTPVVRRIRQQNMDLGFIAAYLNHTATTGAKLTVESVTASASDPLGFGSPIPGHIVLAGNVTQLQSYLQWIQVLAEEDAGIDVTQRYLKETAVSMTGGTGYTCNITISDQDGGPGASITLVNATETGVLFDASTAIPNSGTTVDNSEAPRDFQALVNDAFTDAVARQAPAGSNYAAMRDAINDYFAGFDSILIAQVGVAVQDPTNADTVQPQEMWTASPPNKTGLRAVDGWTTGQFLPFQQIQARKPWNFCFFNVPSDFATMCHEFGHALGYRDLYWAKDFRSDLAFLGAWSIMDAHESLAHHAAYHKWESGWIPPSRVTTIPPADAKAPLEREALLVPVEYWKDSLVPDAQAQFGAPGMPVVQIIELDLGGDGAVIDRIEARQTGIQFSHNLAPSPAILVTNALQPWDDTRYVSTDATTGDQLYRRELQLLNPFNILQNPGDSFDLAKAPALPAKGIVVTVVDRKEIDGISVFRIKVHRENSAYVDLYFIKGDPYYKSPDLWVDWTGDNSADHMSSSNKPEDHHSYPPGQPTDQGEQVRVPDQGTEMHWLVARVRNGGQVDAENVKLNFQICLPPGGGDRSKNFQTMATTSVPVVKGGNVPQEAPAHWDVAAGFGGHVCLLVAIADYGIPRDSDGSALASADVWAANNWAQKNVDQYTPVSHSPYEPIEFDFSVHNAGWHSEIAYLEPENLPYGMQLTVTPARRTIPAGATVLFRCKLELDAGIIDAGCRNDKEFRIVAFRVEDHTAVPWGGVVYKIKPRKGTVTTLTGFWMSNGVIELNGAVTADPGGGLVRIRLAFEGHDAVWQAAPIGPGGTFTLTVNAPDDSFKLDSVALFEGTALLGESRSATITLNPPAPLH